MISEKSNHAFFQTINVIFGISDDHAESKGCDWAENWLQQSRRLENQQTVR